MPNLSEISIVKTTDPASANSPTGRTDGVFTVVLPSIPIGAIKEVSGFKSETEVTDFSPDAFDFTTESTAPEPGGAIAGIVIAATSDNNRVASNDTFDFTAMEGTEPQALRPPSEEVTFVFHTIKNHADDSISFDGLAVDPTNPNASVPAHTPEWSNLRSSSDPMETPGPDDDVVGLPAVQTDAAVSFTAIALAESGGNSGASVATETLTIAHEGFWLI